MIKLIDHKALKRKKLTIAGWAREHGFRPQTVYAILYDKRYKGTRGDVGRSILRALEHDGLVSKKKSLFGGVTRWLKSL